MSTLKVNSLQNTSGNADITNVGKLVQYKVAKKTDGASTTSDATAGVEISSDFRITLTPQNANNIIFCQGFFSATIISTATSNYKIYKNTATDFSGTSTLIMPPDTNSANVDGNTNYYNNGSGFMNGLSVTAFETAGSTTARTYSPFWSTQSSTIYLNQWSSGAYHTTSTFVVMEIVQ